MTTEKFHKYMPTKGVNLYWIIIAYLIIGYFFPAVGLVALICMVGPVMFAVKRGRWWCGHVCPRGNLYDRLLAKYSPHRQIPRFVKSFGFRLFMVGFIFAMFGVQMYYAWGDINAMGRVFWIIILITTVVGVILSFLYAPRTWCSFCPMGTLSAWVSPKKAPFPAAFKSVKVTDACQTKCKNCAKVCPMQLTPYESRASHYGFINKDCLKCGKCTSVCPMKIASLQFTREGHKCSEVAGGNRDLLK